MWCTPIFKVLHNSLGSRSTTDASLTIASPPFTKFITARPSPTVLRAWAAAGRAVMPSTKAGKAPSFACSNKLTATAWIDSDNEPTDMMSSSNCNSGWACACVATWSTAIATASRICLRSTFPLMTVDAVFNAVLNSDGTSRSLSNSCAALMCSMASARWAAAMLVSANSSTLWCAWWCFITSSNDCMALFAACIIRAASGRLQTPPLSASGCATCSTSQTIFIASPKRSMGSKMCCTK
mmetsp:Transcript_123383/g.356639  ORF Transcript_123383/g.356639 Transcript_123383/m.356639 type:complete len:239 (-) Transcript_123383:441-1157(-)